MASQDLMSGQQKIKRQIFTRENNEAALDTFKKNSCFTLTLALTHTCNKTNAAASCLMSAIGNSG